MRFFLHPQSKKWILHNDRCLDFNPETQKVFANICDHKNPNMMWNFGFINTTAVERFDKIGANS